MNQTRCLVLAAGAWLLPFVPLSAADADQPQRFSVELMDRSADPRVDFYRYANGGWMNRTEIPADKSRWGAFDELGENNWRRIHSILEEASVHPGPAGSIKQKVGDFFTSAMDTQAIEEAGLKPVEADLARIEAVVNVDDLALTVAAAHRQIAVPLFGYTIYADQKKNDTIVLYLEQGGLTLPTRDYYFDEKYEKFRTGLIEHMEKMFVLAGETPQAAQAHAATVFALERQLAEVSKTPTELRDPIANYHKLTVEAAATAMPGFPLRIYLAELGIPESQQEIIVSQPRFFEGLGRLLAEKPIEEWRTYLRWHTLTAAAPYLAASFEEENFRFFGTVLNGTPKQEPRWQRAAKVLNAQIGFGLGQLYVEKYFPPEVKERLSLIIDGMVRVLHDRIRDMPWMTDATKSKGLAKLETFRVIVGFPEKWRDYAALEINRDSYIENVRRAAEFETRRQLAKFGQPFDKTEWLITPQQVNAYFQPSANQLVFLAGILQPPYFDPTMDDAVNYGAIAAVIGHEMTHGFDDKGRLYDKDGNLADWWSQQDADQFMARARKLVDQYNGYAAMPGLNVNGELTLGENIADLGGVSIAYEAFHRSLAGKPYPPKIDGFTADQRFFLAWAQLWRTKTRDDALKRLIMADVHAPGRFRAFAPLINVPEFFEAFDIKEGDPMWRPTEQRAKIW
ncbi:MAG: M13 family metallopeptidase [Opitutaceae bacterium]|nr:M13 family metallopeptidase [Opitutaceae bacterium]